MVNKQLRASLVNFLIAMITGSTKTPSIQDRYRSISWCIPESILESDPNGNRLYLYLSDAEATSYKTCLHQLIAETQKGSLEHLSQRDVRTALQSLASDIWVHRGNHNLSTIRKRAAQFLEDHSRKPVEWTVLWEIQHLSVEESVRVGNVEFISFDPTEHVAWYDFGRGVMADEIRAMQGNAFARIAVEAGACDKALHRAKLQIDDALEVLRVAISSMRLVPEMQRLQERGRHYFAWKEDGGIESHMGDELGFQPVDLTLDADTLSAVATKLEDLQFLFSDQMPPRLRDRLMLATVSIGNSMTRKDLDLRIVDLCTALESMLCGRNDARKAETIAMRYLLLLLAIGKPSYVTNPLELYYRYLKRNLIVHGSARRIGTRDDYLALRYAAKDSVVRMVKLVERNPSIRSLDSLLDHLSNPESMNRASEFLSTFPPSDEAVSKVKNVARELA